MKNCFKEGAISAEFIGQSIAKHQVKTNIGAHEIFLGQVRKDEINETFVESIHYEAHKEMANKKFHDIREEAFSKFNLTCSHIYHSIGKVAVGEICLFVFASSKHRIDARKAVEFMVEKIKNEVLIFGKEILENEGHVWKENN